MDEAKADHRPNFKVGSRSEAPDDVPKFLAATMFSRDIAISNPAKLLHLRQGLGEDS
jgi:hypothetical protein